MKITDLALAQLVVAVFESFTEARSMDAQFDLGEVVQYRDGDILIAVFIPVTDHDKDGKCSRSFKHIQMVEQVNMMIEKVNANDNYLPGVKLGTIMINTCFGGIHTLKKLVLDVLSTHVLGLKCSEEFCPPGKRILAGVIGGTRSSVSMDMAKVLQIFSISQVSYWATNPELSDKTKYNYFFRTVPPDNYQTLAMVSFFKNRGWNYVSIVHNDDAYGMRGYAELVQRLKDAGLCVAISIPLGESASDKENERILKTLVEKNNSRVVVLFSVRRQVQRLFKVARSVKGTDKLTWIASDAWTAIIPTDPKDGSFADVLDGTVGFSLKFSAVNEVESRIRNLTIEDYRDENATLNPWWVEYVQQVKNCTLNDASQSGKRRCAKDESVSDFTGIKNDISDAVNVYLEALNSYHKEVCKNQSGLCPKLRDAAGTNKVAEDLYGYVKNVTFETDDGKLFEFDENQDGPHVYDVIAFDKSRITANSVLRGWNVVGKYDETESLRISSLPDKVNATISTCSRDCSPGEVKIYLQQPCCWHCQSCSHRDYVANNSCVDCSMKEMPNAEKTKCIPIPVRQMQYSSEETIGSIVLGVFGLLCTFAVTVLYVKKRNTAIVKASGRELCFFVLFGVFFTLLNCFTMTAPPSTVFCALNRIILSLGPACMYAGLLMKTLRVVFIFQSKGIPSRRTKSYLEPTPLALITLCVVSVQGLILVPWMALHVPGDAVSYDWDENTAFRSCRHLLNEEIFIGLAYPFFIIAICTVLATVNRNVPTGFRETLFIGFTMYTTCVTWIAFQPLFFTSTEDKPRQLTTLSISLSVSALTVLVCLFGPRCYTIIKHPEQNTLESVMSRRGSNHTPKRKPPVPSVCGIDNPVCSTTGR